jgi:hypothetical protein
MSNTTYTVFIDIDGLTVVVDRRAGVSGPFFTEDRPATLADADRVLKSNGFTRSGDWLLDKGLGGMTLWAELVGPAD